MKIKRSFFRYLAYALEVVVLYVLQDTPKLLPQLWGGKPLLLVVLAIAIAARENQIPSLVFGAVCGVLTDIGGGGIGYFGVMLTLVCFFEAEIFKKYIVPSFWTVFLYAAAAVAVLVGLYFVIFRLLAGVEGAGGLFVSHYLSRMGYTVVCVVPLYFLNRFLYRNL